MCYYIDINLSDIPDCLIQPKVYKAFLSEVNVLDYAASDELIPMMIETVDCDTQICSGSDKEVIQDALNSINNDY